MSDPFPFELKKSSIIRGTGRFHATRQLAKPITLRIPLDAHSAQSLPQRSLAARTGIFIGDEYNYLLTVTGSSIPVCTENLQRAHETPHVPWHPVPVSVNLAIYQNSCIVTLTHRWMQAAIDLYGNPDLKASHIFRRITPRRVTMSLRGHPLQRYFEVWVPI